MPATILTESGEVLLKRTHPTLNNYNVLCSVCGQCNTDVKIILSGLDARSRIFYITNYAVKKQLSTLTLYELVVAGMKKVDIEHPQSDNPDSVEQYERARKTAIKCLNAFQGHRQLGAPLVLTHLLKMPNAYRTHKPFPLYFSSFLAYVELQFPADPGFVDNVAHHRNSDVLHMDASGRVIVTNHLLDYRFRPFALRK